MSPRITVLLAGLLGACGNRVEADPAPPGPTSIPTGATSSEVATVALRAGPPAPPRLPSVVPGPVSSGGSEPSSLPSSTGSAAATSSGR